MVIPPPDMKKAPGAMKHTKGEGINYIWLVINRYIIQYIYIKNCIYIYMYINCIPFISHSIAISTHHSCFATAPPSDHPRVLGEANLQGTRQNLVPRLRPSRVPRSANGKSRNCHENNSGWLSYSIGW